MNVISCTNEQKYIQHAKFNDRVKNVSVFKRLLTLVPMFATIAFLSVSYFLTRLKHLCSNCNFGFLRDNPTAFGLSMFLCPRCRESPTDRLGYGIDRLQAVQKHKWFDGFNWEGLHNRSLSPPIIPKVLSTSFHNFFICLFILTDHY